MDSLPKKVCPKCGTAKPANLEHFHKRVDAKDGLRSECRVCRNANERSRYGSGERNDYAAAYRKANAGKIKQQRKDYRAANAEKIKERRAVYYQANRSRIVAKEKVRHFANHEASLKRLRQYAKANRQKARLTTKLWRELNPEKSRGSAKAYRSSRPEKVRELQRNARARKRNAEGTHTLTDISRQFALQGGRCYWCGCKLIKLGKGRYHVDHREPLSKGGSNGPENIVCACPTCNCRKSDKTPLEFAGRLF